MFATRIMAPNDTSGNPRRGWIVCNEQGTPIDFVDEDFIGPSTLNKSYPDIIRGAAINVTPKEYNSWRKIRKVR